MVAAVGHREPADEVGEPAVREPFEFGVFVQVVVDVPGLVADHEVVVATVHDVVEDHEVGQEDLVHVPPGLEAVQVVLAAFRFEVRRLVGEMLARRVDISPARSRTRVTGSCASHSISSPGCNLRSSRATARSRCVWPSPIGDEM